MNFRMAASAETGACLNAGSAAVGIPANFRIIGLSMALEAKRLIPHYQHLIIYRSVDTMASIAALLQGQMGIDARAFLFGVALEAKFVPVFR